MEVVLGLAFVVYAAGLLRIFVGLGRLRPGMSDERPAATVLVAARNEEKNIVACLNALQEQDYPAPFEVLVLNDSSTDRTAERVAEFSSRDPRIRLLNVPPAVDDTAPKKHALLCGLQASNGELVFVTDADCVVRPRWMSHLASHFEPGVGLVTGAVFFPTERSLIARMRSLDFAAYTFCAAGAMASGWPLIATAMNLAYRREAFEEAGGFGRDAHIRSGDDDLLLHTIVRETDWRAAFAPEEWVLTKPERSVGGFLNQRMRWASKAFRYPPGMTAFLVAAFVLYGTLLAGLPMWLFGAWPGVAIPAAAAGKVLVDALVIWRGARVFHKRELLGAFLPAELVHLPYILLASVGGAMGLFRWKGR
ncbi:MAG: glycosyltransferase [Rhodothermales bacterium]|nr:glycosyltransferase [Rhodothermales bacterium]MBO6778970.1 glycosyltransferase [Rhodothermales bacterium]